jgi:hypothetical protein
MYYYVDFTDQYNVEGKVEKIGRVTLSEKNGKNVVAYSADFPPMLIDMFENNGVRADETCKVRVKPKDGMAFMKALSVQFSGSTIRATEVKKHK